MRPDATIPAPEGTRLALIEAAMHLFGRKGFAATSTREIAARANTNIASIAYHFGGKDGLRLACGREFARRVRAELARTQLVPPATRQEARQELETVLRTMVTFIVGAPEAADMSSFVLREMAENGPAIDELYGELIAPVHRLLCALWGAATGQDPESETVRLSVFSFMGQVVYFRIGRPVVERRMGWDGIDAAALGQISDVIVGNLRKVLETGGTR